VTSRDLGSSSKNDVLISVLVPCKNRTHDLKNIMFPLLEAVKASPPVEIVVLDYNSDDDLEDYINDIKRFHPEIVYFKYTGRDTYHMAHAWNLNAKLTKGDWIVVLGTDIIPHVDYFKFIREHQDATWIHGPRLEGVLAVRRQEFMDSGGYDERFEWYGPEDRDFEDRLVRRGGKLVIHPKHLLSEIYTGMEDKFKNYRPITRKERRQVVTSVHNENKDNGCLVANEGKEWGSWNSAF
jgi:glycosyltransferase involved in cell wall biosynthesis